MKFVRLTPIMGMMGMLLAASAAVAQQSDDCPTCLPANHPARVNVGADDSYTESLVHILESDPNEAHRLAAVEQLINTPRFEERILYAIETASRMDRSVNVRKAAALGLPKYRVTSAIAKVPYQEKRRGTQSRSLLGKVFGKHEEESLSPRPRPSSTVPAPGHAQRPPASRGLLDDLTRPKPASHIAMAPHRSTAAPEVPSFQFGNEPAQQKVPQRERAQRAAAVEPEMVYDERSGQWIPYDSQDQLRDIPLEQSQFSESEAWGTEPSVPEESVAADPEVVAAQEYPAAGADTYADTGVMEPELPTSEQGYGDAYAEQTDTIPQPAIAIDGEFAATMQPNTELPTSDVPDEEPNTVPVPLSDRPISFEDVVVNEVPTLNLEPAMNITAPAMHFDYAVLPVDPEAETVVHDIAARDSQPAMVITAPAMHFEYAVLPINPEAEEVANPSMLESPEALPEGVVPTAVVRSNESVAAIEAFEAEIEPIEIASEFEPVTFADPMNEPALAATAVPVPAVSASTEPPEGTSIEVAASFEPSILQMDSSEATSVHAEEAANAGDSSAMPTVQTASAEPPTTEEEFAPDPSIVVSAEFNDAMMDDPNVEPEVAFQEWPEEVAATSPDQSPVTTIVTNPNDVPAAPQQALTQMAPPPSREPRLDMTSNPRQPPLSIAAKIREGAASNAVNRSTRRVIVDPRNQQRSDMVSASRGPSLSASRFKEQRAVSRIVSAPESAPVKTFNNVELAMRRAGHEIQVVKKPPRAEPASAPTDAIATATPAVASAPLPVQNPAASFANQETAQPSKESAANAKAEIIESKPVSPVPDVTSVTAKNVAMDKKVENSVTDAETKVLRQAVVPVVPVGVAAAAATVTKSEAVPNDEGHTSAPKAPAVVAAMQSPNSAEDKNMGAPAPVEIANQAAAKASVVKSEQAMVRKVVPPPLSRTMVPSVASPPILKPVSSEVVAKATPKLPTVAETLVSSANAPPLLKTPAEPKAAVASRPIPAPVAIPLAAPPPPSKLLASQEPSAPVQTSAAEVAREMTRVEAPVPERAKSPTQLVTKAPEAPAAKTPAQPLAQKSAPEKLPPPPPFQPLAQGIVKPKAEAKEEARREVANKPETTPVVAMSPVTIPAPPSSEETLAKNNNSWKPTSQPLAVPVVTKTKEISPSLQEKFAPKYESPSTSEDKWTKTSNWKPSSETVLKKSPAEEESMVTPPAELPPRLVRSTDIEPITIATNVTRPQSQPPIASMTSEVVSASFPSTVKPSNPSRVTQAGTTSMVVASTGKQVLYIPVPNPAATSETDEQIAERLIYQCSQLIKEQKFDEAELLIYRIRDLAIDMNNLKTSPRDLLIQINHARMAPTAN